MAPAEVVLSEKLLLVFCCFTNKMVLFGLPKAFEAINSSFKDYFDRSKHTSMQLPEICRAGNHTSSEFNKFKSSLHYAGQLSSTQRNCFMQT